MIYIVEGPQSSGKSTLIEELKNLGECGPSYPDRIVTVLKKPLVDGSRTAAQQWYEAIGADRSLLREAIVTDRVSPAPAPLILIDRCLLSNAVYTALRYNLKSPYFAGTILEGLWEQYRSSLRLIICLPPTPFPLVARDDRPAFQGRDYPLYEALASWLVERYSNVHVLRPAPTTKTVSLLLSIPAIHWELGQ